MNVKAIATVLIGAALAVPAFAQSDNVPPNAVEDQSFGPRQSAEPPPADAGISFVFEQVTLPPETQAVIPMAPRTGKASEAQPVDRATPR